jgi:transcriptional regulator with XRE-family HTH domain
VSCGKKPANRTGDASDITEAQVYFGRCLRALREEHGLSQGNLAQLVGMQQIRFPAIEAGRQDVRLSTIHRFAKALGVSLPELFPPGSRWFR